MAEIPIERREHRGGLWAWLIGLVALLLLIWLAVGRRHAPQTAAARYDTTSSAGEITPGTPYPGATGAAPSAATPSVATASGALSEFSRFIGAPGPNRTDTELREYTAGGIRRLADALTAQGATGVAIDNMRNKADALESSGPNSAKHADMARSAFLSAAAAFDSLKQSHANVDVSRVQSAADAVRPGTHFVRQNDKIQAFFDSARDALQQMSPAR